MVSAFHYKLISHEEWVVCLWWGCCGFGEGSCHDTSHGEEGNEVEVLGGGGGGGGKWMISSNLVSLDFIEPRNP